ncbi:hypothetical protein ABE438_02295 [Bosea sp. TWI1241]|uniref:baeRF11 domain-containing protein n=1 Tax=Bosea sp. TWI1241 TaxID=3148904 RepID=UPI0032079C45
MLYVDTPSHAEIVRLNGARSDACVSIYVPTTPLTEEVGASRIAFRNLVREAIGQLEAGGLDKRRIWPLQEELDAVAEDDALWRHMAHSLAVFATPETIRVHRLANRLPEMVQVSDRFHLKPLLRAVTFAHEAYILALSENHVRLIEISSDLPPEPVKVEGLPKDAASHARLSSISKSHGSESNRRLHIQYCRAIDSALRPVIGGSGIPLIVAAVDPLGQVYPSVNRYDGLLPEVIRQSPDHMSDAELAQAAIPLLDNAYAAELSGLCDLFAQRDGQGRAMTDISDAARAATRGQIDVLMVDMDAVVPGTVDEDGVVAFAETDDAVAYGVVDEIAGRVLAAGGRVLAVRKADLPEGAETLAAILRYAG